MSTVLSRRKASDTGIVVKYSPCAKNEQTDEEELDEIAIVDSVEKDEGQSSKDLEIVEDGAEPVGTTANGPRHLPGLEIYQSPTDRTKLIGERLSSSDKISVSSPIYSNKVVEQKSKSSSKQSLLDLMSHKFDRVKSGKKRFSLATSSLMKTSRPSVANVVTSREIRRQRKKDIEEKFGKKSARNEKIETSTTTSDSDGCNWTFVFDPSGRLCYWWTSVVSVAFLYNFWVIIYRFAFQEINSDNIGLWFTLDYSADFLYILDIAFRFRTGYLEEGVLQTDPVKLRIHYMNTTIFYIDCLCLLPLDFLYLSIGFCSILRFFRLVKVYRYWTFLDRTERHTNYPNVIRTLTLMHYLLALFHWNSCFFYVVATRFEHDPEYWKFPKNANDTHLQYLHALYWSTMTLTTVGNPPNPRTTGEYFFTIFEMIFALLLFATVLGHIANIVTSISAARKEFQAKLDGVKTYMNLRRVPLKLQDRVIKWFDYLWMCNKSSDEDRALSLLPDKLKAEIAIHVHLDTLKRVEIFQQTEAGFLCELVLRLRPVLFSPGDYICRKDEVGKEMYIVNRGRLQVVADNGKTMLATLKPGSYFGEISILNMGTAGNRRTASVRSVGYSDLFCLSKKDLWDVLKEYPAARVKLEAIAVKRLEKYKKAPLEKIALPRSKSTPGLVESAGKIPIQASMVSRHHTLPANMLTQNSGQNDGHLRAECHSEDNLIARCTENTSNSKTVLRNLTTSMTVSSLTSYNEEGSPLHSPNSVNQTKDFHSPPSSPRCVPPVSCTTTVTSSGVPSFLEPFHQHSQYTFPQHFTQSFPFVSPPQMTYLSPYCASPNYPATPNSNMLSTPGMFAQANMNASQTSLLPPYQPSHPTIQHPQQNLPHTPSSGNFLQPPLSPMPTSPMPPSISPISLNSPNPQSEQLLNEIGRLRERLAQLETENSSLTVKLNQQQWDVENRLAELEMHICQSDSVASTGSGGEEKMDKMTPINRESII